MMLRSFGMILPAFAVALMMFIIGKAIGSDQEPKTIHIVLATVNLCLIVVNSRLVE